VSISGSLKDMTDGPLKPFALALKMLQAPQAVMISHAAYEMEGELRARYPDLQEPCSGLIPASLSPFIIRGLLRRELGFEGLVVSDWYNMGAINDFLRQGKERFGNDAALKSVSPPAAMIILAVYAGVNSISCPSVQTRYGNEFVTAKRAADEVMRYYAGNPSFRRIFESLVAETFYLKAKNMPADFRESLPFRIEDISFGDLSRERPKLPAEKAAALKALNDYVGSLPFTDKLLVLVTSEYNFRNDFAKTGTTVYAMHEFYTEGIDVWNKNAILSLKIRKDVVEELSGKKWPDPPLDQHEEEPWVRSLMEDQEFRAVYDRIDWNGAAMKAAYADALEKRLPGASLAYASPLGIQVWHKVQ
jgi:hypothetical protein